MVNPGQARPLFTARGLRKTPVSGKLPSSSKETPSFFVCSIRLGPLDCKVRANGRAYIFLCSFRGIGPFFSIPFLEDLVCSAKDLAWHDPAS